MFSDQYRIFPLKYAIGHKSEVAWVAHHQPLPVVISDSKHSHRTTENLQKSPAEHHLAQRRGASNTPLIFFVSHTTLGLGITRVVQPHFSQGSISLKAEAEHEFHVGTVYCEGQLSSWSLQCWHTQTNKDFLGLLLYSTSAHFVVSSPHGA